MFGGVIEAVPSQLAQLDALLGALKEVSDPDKVKKAIKALQEEQAKLDKQLADIARQQQDAETLHNEAQRQLEQLTGDRAAFEQEKQRSTNELREAVAGLQASQADMQRRQTELVVMEQSQKTLSRELHAREQMVVGREADLAVATAELRREQEVLAAKVQRIKEATV